MDGKVRVHVGESVVRRVSVTTTSLSRSVNGFQSGPCAESFETGTGGMGFFELLDGSVKVRVTRLKGLERLRSLLEETLELKGGVSESDGLSDQRHKTSLMNGIVENLRLVLGICIRLELSSGCGISD